MLSCSTTSCLGNQPEFAFTNAKLLVSRDSSTCTCMKDMFRSMRPELAMINWNTACSVVLVLAGPLGQPQSRYLQAGLDQASFPRHLSPRNIMFRRCLMSEECTMYCLVTTSVYNELWKDVILMIISQSGGGTCVLQSAF